MSTSTMTSKGQITIPKKIREFLGIHSGDRIEYITQSDGSVVMKPATSSVTDLKGMLKSYYKGSAISVEKMNQAIKNRYRRSV